VPNPDGRIISPEWLFAEPYYLTGTGQKLQVHSPPACAGEFCVVHNPSDHSMREFPTHWREDRGIMERICPHGVGHPDPDDLVYQERHFPQRAASIHGCDGCCATMREPAVPASGGRRTRNAAAEAAVTLSRRTPGL
jgi:hypothetical protein